MSGLRDLIADGGQVAEPSAEKKSSGGSNKELMEDARLSLSGSWLMTMLGMLGFGALLSSASFFLGTAVFFVASTFSVDSVGFDSYFYAGMALLPAINFIFSGSILVGWCSFFDGLALDGMVEMERLFLGFRRFPKAFATYLFYSLFVGLLSLLLVVPGLMAAYSYSMAFFILADDEECGPLEALNRSREMMKGNKWKLFCLQCRFIGWTLLASLSLGIGYLWVVPYMHTTIAKFYEDIS